MGHKCKAALNGFGVAGGVKHHIKELAVAGRRQRLFVALTQGDGVRHAQLAAAKLDTVLAAINSRHLRTAQAGKNHGRHADGACAHHQHTLAGLYMGAAHGVRANRQKLHHRGLVQRHAVSLVHKGFGQRQVLGESAIAVYAQHLNIDAAIGLALAASHTAAAGDIGHHIDHIARRQTAAGRCFFDHTRQLVPHDTRVLQKRLVAGVDVHVGTAHANALDAHQHLALGAHRAFALLRA